MTLSSLNSPPPPLFQFCSDVPLIHISLPPPLSHLKTTLVATTSIEISVGSSSTLQETCGICGTQNGELFNVDEGTVAVTVAERMAFVRSYRVAGKDQSLRPQRAECGKKKFSPQNSYEIKM